ncbi:MAG: hypothetical protein AAB388_00705 [Patescibacteria group bacterium]
MAQKHLSERSRLLLITLLVLVLGYFVVQFAIKERLADLTLQTEILVSEQAGILATIAETTARNGADAVTERIIRDCALEERTRFDELLGSLDQGLQRSELTELERLFGRCGNFYAERKSVMVARLAREVEIYRAFVTQLNNLSDADISEKYQVEKWSELVKLEEQQSELFSKLVLTQDNIITHLLSGKNANGTEIQTTLGEAKELQETLVVVSKQAASIRGELVKL